MEQIQGLWKVKNQNMSNLCEEAKILKGKFHSFQIAHVLRVRTYTEIHSSPIYALIIVLYQDQCFSYYISLAIKRLLLTIYCFYWITNSIYCINSSTILRVSCITSKRAWTPRPTPKRTWLFILQVRLRFPTQYVIVWSLMLYLKGIYMVLQRVKFRRSSRNSSADIYGMQMELDQYRKCVSYSNKFGSFFVLSLKPLGRFHAILNTQTSKDDLHEVRLYPHSGWSMTYGSPPLRLKIFWNDSSSIIQSLWLLFSIGCWIRYFCCTSFIFLWQDPTWQGKGRCLKQHKMRHQTDILFKSTAYEI